MANTERLQPTVAPPPSDEFSVGDLVEPGAHGGVSAKLDQALKRPHEGLLNEVFGGLAVSRKVLHEAEHVVIVEFDPSPERFLVPCPDALDSVWVDLLHGNRRHRSDRPSKG